MTIRRPRTLTLVAAGLFGLAGLLAGCANSNRFDVAADKPADAAASPDITGSVAPQPAAQAAPPAQPAAPPDTALHSAILPFLFLGAGS